MNVAEKMMSGLKTLHVLENWGRASFPPAGDDIATERVDLGRKMGAQDLNWTKRLEFASHLLIGHFTCCSERRRDASADESDCDPLDFVDLAVNESHPLGQHRRQHVRIVDVSVGTEPNRPDQRFLTTGVLSLNPLADGRPYLIRPFTGDFPPRIAHGLVVAACPVSRHPGPELLAQDIGDDSLAGPVIEEIDEVPQDQERLTPGDDGREGIEGPVNIGHQKHL